MNNSNGTSATEAAQAAAAVAREPAEDPYADITQATVPTGLGGLKQILKALRLA